MPEPHQNLQTHTDVFRRQGFSQAEMITLVACGHTLGGVRSPDFPDIVSPGGDPEKPSLTDFDPSQKFDGAL